MIFYERKKLPRVWSGKNKRPAVVFHDGIFESEDQELIDLLVKAGYPHEKPKAKAPVKKKVSQPTTAKPDLSSLKPKTMEKEDERIQTD